MMRKSSKICEHTEERQWIGFNNSTKGHRIYWPTRCTISVEYDVNFTPAPHPLLLEGEIGEIYFNFNAAKETLDPPTKPSTKVSPEPVKIVDQEAVTTQNHQGQRGIYPVGTL